MAGAKLERLLYKTVGSTAVWQGVLEEISNITGAPKAIIMLRDKQTAELYITKYIQIELESPMLFGFSEEQAFSYISHFYKFDPWTSIEKNHHPFVPYAMSSYLSISDLQKGDFWEWLAPQNISDTVVAEIHSSKDSWVSINVFYNDEDTEVKDKTLVLLTKYQMLMQEVWEEGLQYRAVHSAPESLDYFLEQLEQPAMLVRANGQLVKQNLKAEHLLNLSGGKLRSKDGYLFIRNKAEREELLNKIDNLSKRGELNGKEGDIVLGHFSISCTLLGDKEDIIGFDDALRLLVIRKEKYSYTADIPIWQTPSLTNRERDLVEVLATGGRVVDFSQKFGIAKSTSHAHWGNVKNKLDITDRAQIYAQHQLYLRTSN